MKSIRNLLIMSVVLTVALCTAVQVTAMVVRRENPHLSVETKESLRQRMTFMRNQYNELSKPTSGIDAVTLRKLRRQIEENEQILYGNRLYTEAEITAAGRLNQ
jgi:hypothetical protein